MVCLFKKSHISARPACPAGGDVSACVASTPMELLCRCATVGPWNDHSPLFLYGNILKHVCSCFMSTSLFIWIRCHSQNECFNGQNTSFSHKAQKPLWCLCVCVFCVCSLLLLYIHGYLNVVVIDAGSRGCSFFHFSFRLPDDSTPQQRKDHKENQRSPDDKMIDPSPIMRV